MTHAPRTKAPATQAPVIIKEADLPETIAYLRDTSSILQQQPLAGKKILIIVENLPVPFDRRVWLEARTLRAAGAEIFVICPTGKDYNERYEYLEGIHVYRHDLPLEADGPIGFLVEYGAALFWESWLAWKIYFKHGLNAIHGCNPPDLIFLVAIQFRLFGVKYLFDHHDINPELFVAKYDKKGFFWKLMNLFERVTFRMAKVSIATNESYKNIAVTRGRKDPDDVFVVRSGPDLSRVKQVPPNDKWRNGRGYMIGYVGVMGQQEGLDLLLESMHHIVHKLGREDVQMCLVGGGPALDMLKDMAKELNIADYVTFTGRAPDADLFEILCTSDLCVNPDKVNPMNNLSTMNKIMEYMAMGKPIVQFEVREGRFSAREASLYAKANDPIDMADKILDLLADEKLRKRMADFGNKRVREQLSWQQQIKPLINAYHRLFDQSPIEDNPLETDNA